MTFTVTIPAGVGTGCEAAVYEYGDGQRLEAYTPCGIAITPAAPGVTPTPFVLPTWPPRRNAEAYTYMYTYERPGTYVAQFALSEKPSDRIIAVSNTVTITVT